MLVKANVDQAIMAAPSVGIDYAFDRGFSSDNGLQCGFSGIGYDLRVDAAIALKKTEHDGFAGCVAPAFAAYPARAEVGFVGFKLAGEGRDPGAFFGQAMTQTKLDVVDRAHGDAREFRRIGRGQIQREVAQDLPELGAG